MPIAALRPLRHRDFAVLWAGGLVSNVGTWMQTVAVGALVTGLTRNPIWTAVAFVAGFLPNGLLAPVGGALADRFDRRWGAIIGTSVETLLAASLAALVATGHTSPYLITFIVFLAGCVGAVRMPFQQAMLPDLVPREDIVGAIGLGSAQWNLGRVIGPALAGLVIVIGSFAAAFAINALSFLAVIVAFVVIKVPSPPEPDAEITLFGHMRAGAREVRSSPPLRAAIGLIAIAGGLAAPFIALIPAVAAHLTGGNSKAIAGATAALTTAQGVGAVAGALVFPSLVDRFGRRRMILAVLVLTPVALIPYALAPTVPTAIAALVVVGASYICVLSGLSAVMQLRAPAAFRGRVLSLYFATLSVIFPLGAVVQGALARRIGLPATTMGGAVLLLGAVAFVAVARPQVFGSLDDLAVGPSEVPAVTDAANAQAAS